MTADGELFIDEDCRDFFQKELDKAFGKGKWRLDGGKFSDVWDTSELPKVCEVPIVDEDADWDENGDWKVIGTAFITLKFGIVGNPNGGEKYIEAEPKSIKITKVKHGTKRTRKI